MKRVAYSSYLQQRYKGRLYYSCNLQSPKFAKSVLPVKTFKLATVIVRVGFQTLVPLLPWDMRRFFFPSSSFFLGSATLWLQVLRLLETSTGFSWPPVSEESSRDFPDSIGYFSKIACWKFICPTGSFTSFPWTLGMYEGGALQPVIFSPGFPAGSKVEKPHVS